MVTTAYVKLWDHIIGAVAWDDNTQFGTFEYTPEFMAHGREVAPIKMPLSEGNQIFSFPELRVKQSIAEDTFKGLPGLLADVLPDRYGNQLINSWLAQNGRSENSMNPIEQLCFIGTRGMGALEFEPTTFTAKKNTFSVELDSMVDIAHKMLSNRDEFHADLSKDEEQAMKDILRIGTSAGGARPKAIIAYNEKTGEVRSGQSHVPKGFKHWLIKLDGVSDTQFGKSHGYGRVEMAYYHMATACGINMMPSRLLEENGRAHFMTQRFDRDTNNQKHHVQTFCAMQHYDYNDVNSFSYEQLFQTMRILGLPYPQAEEVYRRMVFNVLAQNCDDHTKNFAFLLPKDKDWSIAPAYDICYAYSPESIWVHQHALSINGKRKNVTRKDLETIGKSMNIKNRDDIIDETLGVVKQWNKYANEVGVENALKNKIQKTIAVLLKEFESS